MTKEESYLSTAQQLLELVGGKENVVSAAHCATRLRLVLKDELRVMFVNGIRPSRVPSVSMVSRPFLRPAEVTRRLILSA